MIRYPDCLWPHADFGVLPALAALREAYLASDVRAAFDAADDLPASNKSERRHRAAAQQAARLACAAWAEAHPLWPVLVAQEQVARQELRSLPPFDSGAGKPPLGTPDGTHHGGHFSDD